MSGDLSAELIINKEFTETELSGKLKELNINLWKLQEQIKRLEIIIGKQPIKRSNIEAKATIDKYKGSLISRIC